MIFSVTIHVKVFTHLLLGVCGARGCCTGVARGAGCHVGVVAVLRGACVSGAEGRGAGGGARGTARGAGTGTAARTVCRSAAGQS